MLLNTICYFEIESFLSNYVDDNVLYAFHSDREEVKENLDLDLSKLSEWFYENSMILISDKYHYICLGKNVASDLLQIK